MVINSFHLTKYDNGFWSSKSPHQDVTEHTEPYCVLHQFRPNHWRFFIMQGKWCEEVGFRIEGPFNYCIKQAKQYI